MDYWYVPDYDSLELLYTLLYPNIQVDTPAQGSDPLHSNTQVENWLTHIFPTF